MIWKKNSFVFLIAMLCCALWASAAPFIKKGYALFSISASDTPSILVFAGLRFVLAGLFVLMVDRLIHHKEKKEKVSFRHVCVLACFQTAGQYFLYYVGLAHTSGVNGSIICGMGSFFALLLACYVFKSEKMTIAKLSGVLLGFCGIVWMNLGGTIGGSWFGNSLVIASQISSALSTCFINRFTQKEDPVRLSGSQFCLGGLVLILIGLLKGGQLPHGAFLSYFVIVYLACVSAIAYTLWSLLLAHNPVSRIGIFNTTIPILGVFLSAFILNEYQQAFTMRTMIALILVSTGIVVLTKSKTVKE